MLNRRHKAILFITLVMTGSALLAGAQLNEGLGIFILGATLAWLIGSRAAARAFHFLKVFPGKTWPWTRVLILMLLGGAVLASVAVLSNLNSFLAVAAMSIFGMLISPFVYLPTQRRWMKWVVWITGVVVFFIGDLAVLTLSKASPDSAQRMGELVWWGLVALAIGILWLTKGWRLIVAGMTAATANDSIVGPGSTEGQNTVPLYLSLFTGTVVLSLWLGLLAFSAFSQAVFPFDAAGAKPPNSSNPISAVLFLMLLAWWPYASWRSVLTRKPNTAAGNVRAHRRVTLALGALFTIIISVAITFGIQNGNDRSMTAQVQVGTKDFQAVAVEIGAIKSRDLQTTDDYIQAYAEIGSLLPAFNSDLQKFTDILAEAKRRDASRGPLNIQRLYGPREKEWLVWDDRMFELLRKDSELTSKEVNVAEQMGTLPKQYQVEFWKKNFKPLTEEENELRRQIMTIKASTPAHTAG